MVYSEVTMSINSIDHDEMSEITDKWDINDEVDSQKPTKSVRSAEVRRRIEALKEIRESGLTLEEAKELGIWH